MTLTKQELLAYERDDLTLEQIGQRQSPPITRERVRQIFLRVVGRPKTAQYRKADPGKKIAYCRNCSQKIIKKNYYPILYCKRCRIKRWHSYTHTTALKSQISELKKVWWTARKQSATQK